MGEGISLPPIRAYMHNFKTHTTIRACTMQLLRKLQKTIKLAQIKIKPSKFRSISTIKGKLSEQCFQICNESITMVTKKPIKSLRC